MNAPPSLGCMLLYKNEREHLERIVPKILEAFDHPIFVTNQESSTDGSDEFLQDHGIEPLRMEWAEDFSVARQFGLDRSPADYTLWMDADDDLLTSCASFAEAKKEVKRFLTASRMPWYRHRIYYSDQSGYWLRENWFHRDGKVRVKYPTHEVYACEGPQGDFPPGLIDRRNAPLKPNYPGKLWRYYDMLYKYLQEVDPNDLRCKYYLAREFRGPACARVALFRDYLDSVHRVGSYRNFSEEWWATFTLYTLREAIPVEELRALGRKLVLRHPFEFTAQLCASMIECETAPTVENGHRLYRLLIERNQYQHTRSPQHRGWYFQKALNSAGFTCYRISLETKSREMAEHGAALLHLAVSEEGVPDSEKGLARNNLKVAEAWLRGFPSSGGSR